MHWHSIYSGPTTVELRQLLARRSEFYLSEDHEAVLSLLGEHIGYMVHVSEVMTALEWSRPRAIRVMEEVAEAFQLPSAVVSSPHGRGQVYVWGKVIESGAWKVEVEASPTPSYQSVASTVRSSSRATDAAPPKATPSPVLTPARGSAPTDRAERVTPGNSAKRVALIELAEKRPELSRTCALFDVMLDEKNLPVHETYVESWDGQFQSVAGDFTRRDAIEAAQATLQRGSTKLEAVATALAGIRRASAISSDTQV